MTRRWDRWRGLKDLVVDAVEHGSAAVEGVHRELTRRPFVVLEHVPAIASPAHTVHVVADASLSAVYGSIRLVNRLVGKAADLAFDLAEDDQPADGRSAAKSGGPNATEPSKSFATHSSKLDQGSEK